MPHPGNGPNSPSQPVVCTVMPNAATAPAEARPASPPSARGASLPPPPRIDVLEATSTTKAFAPSIPRSPSRAASRSTPRSRAPAPEPQLRIFLPNRTFRDVVPPPPRVLTVFVIRLHNRHGQTRQLLCCTSPPSSSERCVSADNILGRARGGRTHRCSLRAFSGLSPGSIFRAWCIPCPCPQREPPNQVASLFGSSQHSSSK